MKRLNTTHAVRHAAFVAEFGGEYPRNTSPEFQALCGELIGQDTPAMMQDRIAVQGTLQGYIDNSPETYGRKCATLAPHGIADGASCDVDNGEELTLANGGAVTLALDMSDKEQAERLNVALLPATPQKPAGRGRPRRIAADSNATPETQAAIREAELRFDRVE